MSESAAIAELQQARALLQANQIDAGIERLTVLANQKFPEAMFELASVLLMLATDAEKIASAMLWLREAETLGSAQAMYRLATISLIESAEVLDWNVLATRWQTCCRQGHPNALCDAALYFGRHGTPRQQNQSTAMLETAAIHGSIVAMALLGERLAEGRFCKADPARANSIRQLAAELGIGHKVLFTGFLRGKDIPRVFSMADLYVMPSVSEPFGIAPLEALGHRVPVLISRQSGVSEVLTNALKVDFWDVDDMANKIVAVLRHPPLQRTLTDHGFDEVRGITWDGAAAKVDAVYERAMAAVNRR